MTNSSSASSVDDDNYDNNNHYQYRQRLTTASKKFIVDANLMSLSMNCHTALTKYLQTRRGIESDIFASNRKIKVYEQNLLKQMEENVISEWTRFFNYINTKRPFDIYYNLKLHVPKRSDTISFKEF